VSLVYASNALTVSNLRLDVGLFNLRGSSLGKDAQGPQRRCPRPVGRQTQRHRRERRLGFWVPASTACRFRTWLEISTWTWMRLFAWCSSRTARWAGYGRHQDAGDATILFAPARAIASLNLGLNELFLRQDVAVENLGQYDLRAGSGSTAFTARSAWPVPADGFSASDSSDR